MQPLPKGRARKAVLKFFQQKFGAFKKAYYFCTRFESKAVFDLSDGCSGSKKREKIKPKSFVQKTRTQYLCNPLLKEAGRGSASWRPNLRLAQAGIKDKAPLAARKFIDTDLLEGKHESASSNRQQTRHLFFKD
ncbi:hypothetical protein [Phaeodactylibacter luteus]|uniref:Uncharacterized protein n=1 Tax=Phaeodactylibacter luteus TaxID=1564516 RepID=A0A5C6RGT2_9BACT|nr:hypothetical protein [Phaeodactylibacter luteus]TXB59737.1 hypothetical protein FRY97_21000 [Phaeodactylibacter luteus]